MTSSRGVQCVIPFSSSSTGYSPASRQKNGRAPQCAPCQIRGDLYLIILFGLIRLLWNLRILFRRLWMLCNRCDGCRSSCAAHGKFRGPVLWRANVPMNGVLADLVYHYLHRLRFILRMDPDRLEEVHSLLAKLIVVNDHRHVVIHVFRIGPAQGESKRSEALELLGFREIKFEIVPLATLLQHYQFFMSLGDRPVQFIFCRT